MEDELNQLEKEVKESLDVDVSEVREAAIKKAKGEHKWRQRGNQIICESCDFRHGFFVKPGVVMTGVKNGMPILKDLMVRKKDK